MLEWFQSYDTDSSVCALKFTDHQKTHYLLRTFPNRSEALDSGFIITHTHPCGACSSLKDLAIYLDQTDLTTPTRECSKNVLITQTKKCLKEKIGFTNACAEAWAYNAANTKKNCMGVCIRDYGLINLIFNLYPESDTDSDGNLRPCDDETSRARVSSFFIRQNSKKLWDCLFYFSARRGNHSDRPQFIF